jgi:hypothetical protein
MGSKPQVMHPGEGMFDQVEPIVGAWGADDPADDGASARPGAGHDGDWFGGEPQALIWGRSDPRPDARGSQFVLPERLSPDYSPI